MRILVLSNVPPETIGGAEVRALQLASSWVNCGHSVILAGYANRPRSEGALTVTSIPTLRHSRSLRAISYLFSTLRLLWVRRNDFDVIYCRFLKEQAVAASLAKIVLGLEQPLVVCPACASSGGDAFGVANSPLSRLWVLLLRRGVTVVNAMSEDIAREVAGLGLRDVVVTRIPNGIALPKSEGHRKSDGEALRVVFVGRLVEQKGLDILLKAFASLRAGVERWQLHIIGDGPLREALVSQAWALGLSTLVHFHGGMSPDEVSGHLIRSDLFVLPSRYEGMSGALLEAFAHGLPAVATRVSGTEEIVDSTTGWVVPVDDVNALARALRHAITIGRTALSDMGSRARTKAEAEYSIDLVAERYLSLFRELVVASPKN